MPDGISTAPPIGGAFWWDLDFIDIIYLFRYLDSNAITELLQSPAATAPPRRSLLEQQKSELNLTKSCPHLWGKWTRMK